MVSITFATPSQRLAAFQSRHVIAPRTVDDPILGPVAVCGVDRVRIHPIRTGWRHDTAETTRLLAEVNGGSWPRSLTAVAAVAADVALEDAFSNGRLTFDWHGHAVDVDIAEDDEWTNREGMPEFNGSFR